MTKSTRRVVLQVLETPDPKVCGLGFVVDYMPGLVTRPELALAYRFTNRTAQMVLDVVSKTPAYQGIKIELVTL